MEIGWIRFQGALVALTGGWPGSHVSPQNLSNPDFNDSFSCESCSQPRDPAVQEAPPLLTTSCLRVSAPWARPGPQLHPPALNTALCPLA